MKQLLVDIRLSMERDGKKFILLVIQFAIFFILVGNVILYFIHDLEDPEILNIKNNSVYHKLYQNESKSSMVELWENPFIIEKMEATLKSLRESEEFIFSSFSWNNEIRMFTEELEDHFQNDDYEDFLAYSLFPGYYSGNDYKPVPDEYWDGRETIGMSLCKVDSNALNHYQLKVDHGRNFKSQDFSFDLKQNEVSIILGDAYKPYYQLGESIEIATPIKIMKATIIGFLPKNTSIENDTTYEHIGESRTTLDYSVIMPCFDFKGDIDTEEDKMFVSLEYISNLCGTLIFSHNVPEKKIESILKGINDYYLDNGVFTVITLTSTNGLVYFQGEEKITVDLLNILLVFLLIFNIATLYISMAYKINKNAYITAIQMINGRTLLEIVTGYIIEIALVILVGIFIAYLHEKSWFYQAPIFHISFFVLNIIIIAVCALFLSIKLKKINIEQELRWKKID